MNQKDKDALLQKLEYHFKCDCAVCVVTSIDSGNIPKSCNNQHKCEVARSYFQIVNMIEGL